MANIIITTPSIKPRVPDKYDAQKVERERQLADQRRAERYALPGQKSIPGAGSAQRKKLRAKPLPNR